MSCSLAMTGSRGHNDARERNGTAFALYRVRRPESRADSPADAFEGQRGGEVTHDSAAVRLQTRQTC